MIHQRDHYSPSEPPRKKKEKLRQTFFGTYHGAGGGFRMFEQLINNSQLFPASFVVGGCWHTGPLP